MSNWKKFSEELPSDQQWILVYQLGVGIYSRNVHYTEKTEFELYDQQDYLDNSPEDYSHWMPFPEPPE